MRRPNDAENPMPSHRRVESWKLWRVFPCDPTPDPPLAGGDGWEWEEVPFAGFKSARRPVSRVLSSGPSPREGAAAVGWPFIWDACRQAPRATYPGGGSEDALAGCPAVPPLFDLAPGGVYRAAPVARGAVRSYRTLSPLPAPRSPERAGGRRFAFCGTFPRVAPARRYLAPFFRGARTFLPPTAFAIVGRRPSGRLAGGDPRRIDRGMQAPMAGISDRIEPAGYAAAARSLRPPVGPALPGANGAGRRPAFQ